MKSVPMSERKHVCIFGNTNAGKSALFNAIIGQELTIVSDVHGTTTDPVVKAMELIPFGPIVLVDTAGLNDVSTLGAERTKRSTDMLGRTDLALYVSDVREFDESSYEEACSMFNEHDVSHILVFSKCDGCPENVLEHFRKKYPEAAFVSIEDKDSIAHLRDVMCKALESTDDSGEESMIGGLVSPGSTVVLVVPVDSEAPKGRLILPQVQLIRDCLDHGVKCYVMRDVELESSIEEVKKSALVVVDSQIFGKVDKAIPNDVPLTSFSMLLARQKGDLYSLAEGAKYVDHLKDGSRVLMAEACSHNHTHEDIGRVKIPALMRKYTGKYLQFEHYSGYDFPDDLNEYDMVVHCGACMITRKALQYRMKRCTDAGVPMTNYGVLLAYLNGILDRCSGALGM